MPASAPAEAAVPVLVALRRLRNRALAAESGVLDALAVLGEPRAQHLLDGWLDVAAATLGAVADEAVAQTRRLAPEAEPGGPSAPRPHSGTAAPTADETGRRGPR